MLFLLPGLLLVAGIALTGVAAGAAVSDPPSSETASRPGGETAPMASTSGPSGLPLPRFASINAREANMRAGPGLRYPVSWVYHRRGLPVRIIGEFEHWRQVEDSRGTVGWMHRAVLSGRRMAIMAAPAVVLRRAIESSPPVARAEAGAIVRLLRCREGWCRIEADGLNGYVPQSAIWGTLSGETVN